MKKYSCFLAIILTIFVFLTYSEIMAQTTGNNTNQSQELSKSDAQKMLGKTGSFFIPNKGQINDNKGKARPDILFLGEFNNLRMYFTKNSISYVMYQVQKDKTPEELDFSKNNEKKSSFKSYRFDMEFLNTNPDVIVESGDFLTSKYNYFTSGTGENGVTGISPCQKIYYKNLYKGIDVVFYTTSEGLKYDFEVGKEGNVADIQIKYNGIDDLVIENGRNLKIVTPLGSLIENLPSTYQFVNYKKDNSNIDNFTFEKKEIKCDYIKNDKILSFNVESYDKNYPLIIDPEVKWGTYIGASMNERVAWTGNAMPLNGGMEIAGGGISFDPDSNIIITGATHSQDFPADILYWDGDYDIFIFKLSKDGTTRMWATYLGGYDDDFGTDVAVQSNGNVIGVGTINSSTGSYTLCLNALQYTKDPNGCDMFLTRLNGSTGARLNFTYFGGNGEDYATRVKVDVNDAVYLLGTTSSSTWSVPFPVNTYSGSGDAILCKFNQYLGTNDWKIYIGGEGPDYGLGMDLLWGAQLPGIAICGLTYSATQFPLWREIYSQINNGVLTEAYDGYVAVIEIDNYGEPMINFCTYYGGENNDFATSVSYPLPSFLTITGWSQSPNLPIPSLPSEGQRYISDVTYGDAFVAQFVYSVSQQPAHVWSTFLGGNLFDRANDITFNWADQSFYIVGTTKSINFPNMNKIQNVLNNNVPSGPYYDSFIARYSLAGVKTFASFYGGSTNDKGIGIISKGTDNTIICGETYGNMPFDNNYSLYPYSNNGDAFVTKFDLNQSNLPTYLGGSDQDEITGITVDAAGFIYVTGWTSSTDLIPTTGVIQTSVMLVIN